MADQSPHINDLLQTYREGGAFPSYDQLAAIAGKDQGSAAVRGEAVEVWLSYNERCEYWDQCGSTENGAVRFVSVPVGGSLSGAMLAIPVEVPFEHQGISQRKAYIAGAEQVRAKAAAIVSARAADALDSQPTKRIAELESQLAECVALSQKWASAAGEADGRTEKLRAAFHVNMLRAFPEKSHEEISAEIDRAASSQPTDGGVRNG